MGCACRVRHRSFLREFLPSNPSRKYMKAIRNVICAAALAAPAVADEPIEAMQLQPQHVAVFSNGYSRVQMEGKLPAAKNVCLQGMPIPVLGSVWWQAPAGTRVLSAEGRVGASDVPNVHCQTMDMLRANVGKRVTLHMGDKRTYSGVLAATPAVKPAVSSYVSDSPEERKDDDMCLMLMVDGGGCVVLGSGAEPQSVEFAEQPALPTKRQYSSQLLLHMAKPAPGESLGMECLAQGIKWCATYRLDLQADGKADMLCKALVVNDMMDMKGVRLELVDGVPSLGGDLSVSPLVRTPAAALRKSKMSNGITMQAAPAMACYGSDDDSDCWLADEESAPEQLAEQHRYIISDFTCANGTSVARELYADTPTYSHVYTCYIGERSVARNRMHEPDEPTVWHCVRVENNSERPWSPGSVMIYSDGYLVARATLNPTAAGRASMLRLTESSDVRVEYLGESEIAASDGAADAGNDDAGLACMGKIVVTNTSGKEVEVELVKMIKGRLNAVPENCSVATVPKEKGNPTSRLAWKLHLAPGQKYTCTYNYTFLVQKNTP